jgi:hypothetical protein
MAPPIWTFTVTPSLPPELERHRALFHNLRWAWNHDACQFDHNLILAQRRINNETEKKRGRFALD